jgi:hypothetical protein
MATNFRKHYALQITNEFGGSPIQPAWEAGWTVRGTIRQVLDELSEAKRRAGGCDVAARFIGDDAPSASIAELREELALRQMPEVR